MSASGYVTLLIRSVESSPSLIASYHLAFKRVLKNNNFFKNHFLISNLNLVVELSAWVVQNRIHRQENRRLVGPFYDMKN